MNERKKERKKGRKEEGKLSPLSSSFISCTAKGNNSSFLLYCTAQRTKVSTTNPNLLRKLMVVEIQRLILRI